MLVPAPSTLDFSKSSVEGAGTDKIYGYCWPDELLPVKFYWLAEVKDFWVLSIYIIIMPPSSSCSNISHQNSKNLFCETTLPLCDFFKVDTDQMYSCCWPHIFYYCELIKMIILVIFGIWAFTPQLAVSWPQACQCSSLLKLSIWGSRTGTVLFSR